MGGIDVPAGLGDTRGYEVAARDLSPGAIRRLRGEAASRGLSIDAAVADMRYVADTVDAPFDAVIAFDNSVPHLSTDDQIAAAFQNFRSSAPAASCCWSSWKRRGSRRPAARSSSISPFSWERWRRDVVVATGRTYRRRLDGPNLLSGHDGAGAPPAIGVDRGRRVDPASFWQRLRRRKLVTWTAAYVTSAAALFGTLEAVGDVFAWPDALLRALFFLLLAGLAVTVTLGWFHGERGRQRVTAGEVALLLAAGALGLAGAAASLRGARAAPAGEAPTALVVEPFVDRSDDGEQAYLAVGVAEEIRRALGVRLGVPVARGSGRDMPGAHVVAGTVQRVGPDIRISARLTDPSGRLLWEEEATAPLVGLVDVEDRIVAAVAGRIGSGRDGRDAGETPSGRRALDPEAHDAWLRGEHALGQRTPASVIQAIARYREATARQPSHAPALAREAYAYGLFLDWGWTYPGLAPEALLDRGMTLADSALAADSLSPEAWLSRAYLAQLADPAHPDLALPAFSRAVGLDPANPEAHYQHGQTLMVLGRYAEARAAYHAALALEPSRPMALVALSAIALREGDTAAARRWGDSSIVLSETVPYPWASRAMLRVGFGEAAGARRDAETALRIDPSYDVPARSTLASALWAAGERERAEEELARARGAIVRPDRPTPTEAYFLAGALLVMDRPEDALALIETARPRSAWLWFYLEAPVFDGIRGEERFRRAVEVAAPELSPQPDIP